MNANELAREIIESFIQWTHGVKMNSQLFAEWASIPEAKSLIAQLSGVGGMKERRPTIREIIENMKNKNFREEIILQEVIRELDRLDESPIPSGEQDGGWVSVKDRLPQVEDKKMMPVLVHYEKYKNKFYHRVAYYFPEHFKTIEWEDWDDYSEENFPFTEDDEKNGCVWLRPGFYDTVECEKCDGYWSSPLNVTHWQPLPPPPKTITP